MIPDRLSDGPVECDKSLVTLHSLSCQLLPRLGPGCINPLDRYTRSLFATTIHVFRIAAAMAILRSLLPLSLLIAIFSQSSPSDAVIVPFQGRTTTAAPPRPVSRFDRRSNAEVPLYNHKNAQYIANATLAGETVRLLLDTGRCVLFSLPHTIYAYPSPVALISGLAGPLLHLLLQIWASHWA